ncbi:MAG TPA: S1 RNA-binding domain-containing protein [Candidatus Kaiserbacteria bacterium]|nr:S1 RNA-binding domain-containing protein [Candidatus Kaiserbacteria bacterium]
MQKEQSTDTFVSDTKTSQGLSQWIDIETLSTPPKRDDLMEGTIVAMGRGQLYVDLPPFGTGIIYGREYLNAADVLRKANIGDTITAKVVDPSGMDGYIELSLKEARQAAIWSEAEQAIVSETTYMLEIEGANRGGLTMTWQGMSGFLPASHLSGDHYPKIVDGDKEKVLSELQKLIGKELSVRIITADAKEKKLIFSEKTSAQDEEKISFADTYHVGDVLEGEVTSIVDFGVFVKLNSGLEGLVHISELDWGLVEDPHTLFKVGDPTQVKIIEIKDGKISLSIKALKENPWHNAAKKYKKGMEVSGVIIRYNKHGALASIEEGVAGLVHISEFENSQELRETLELGNTYSFKIMLFEPKDQRMTLSPANSKRNLKKRGL